MIGMMSSQYQEAGDYSMCFHVCNYHRPRIGRNLPTKRVPGNFVSESRHIQLCQNLRCFFLDDEQQLGRGLWYWIPVFRSNETADLPKQSTAKRTASKIKFLLYGQGLWSVFKATGSHETKSFYDMTILTTYFLLGFPQQQFTSI